MVSTAVIHVIGTAILLSILAMVSLYVYTETSTTIYTNVKRNLERISEVISLQIKYLLYSNTNISGILDYPLEVAYNQYYNIYIGTGSALNNKLNVLPQLDPSSIYAVAITPDEKIYGYSRITNSTIFNNKNIVLQTDPIVFGSSTITRINVTILDNQILIEYMIVGYKT